MARMPDVPVSAEELTPFSREVLVRAGFPPQDAAIQAEVLVCADRRGVDSHGVLRILPYADFGRVRDVVAFVNLPTALQIGAHRPDEVIVAVPPPHPEGRVGDVVAFVNLPISLSRDLQDRGGGDSQMAVRLGQREAQPRLP